MPPKLRDPLDRLQEAIRNFRGETVHLQSAEKLDYAREFVKKLDPDIRGSFEDLYLIGYIDGLDMNKIERDREQRKAKERWAAFLCAVGFLIVLLVIAIKIPHPTRPQYETFRIVLALAAAGFAMFIDGFLEITVAKWLKAAGALAVFAVVYFWSPASAVTEVPTASGTPAASSSSP